MNQNQERLVFGSDKARDILKQDERKKKVREVKASFSHLENEIENLSELILSVSVEDMKDINVSGKVWGIVDLVNTLMIDCRIQPISNVLENALPAIENVDNPQDDLVKAKESLDALVNKFTY